MFSNRHTPLYRFSFSRDCSEPLQESTLNYGRFCDREKLVRESGAVAHYFTFSSDCKDALRESTQSHYDLFCDDGDLIQIHRGVVAYLTFKSNCKDALREASQYRGHFCNGSVLMNYMGQRLHDFTFNSRCKEALRQGGGTVTF